jgi:predicted O-methyltransferase YrrM
MTPKEKAEELVGKCFDTFVNDEDEHYVETAWKLSKQCALIVVDEIIKVLPQQEYLEDRGEYSENRERIYWQEVKQEINLL